VNLRCYTACNDVDMFWPVAYTCHPAAVFEGREYTGSTTRGSDGCDGAVGRCGGAVSTDAAAVARRVAPTAPPTPPIVSQA
jgi:hypothetical protein